MAISQAHFQNAHHFEVNNGQFNNIANTTIINAADTDAVSTILRQYVATGAIFDSAERYPPGKCHPGTREKIIEQIIDWIDDPAATQYIVWLYGPAGSGKSALAQSICEILAQSRPESNGASFFFSKDATDRGNALKLFTTISYQLAIHLPVVRAEINKALNHDPTLPTKSMEVQLLSLIVQPLLQCENLGSHCPVIIIDGLDECSDDEGATTQRNIVSLISKSILDYKLPLRFVVASRPEFWIRDAFDLLPWPKLITLYISLRNSFDADQDIRIYLTDEFEKIHQENKRVMGTVVLPWPPTDIVDRFVYEASGQFIYASTIINFVGKFSRFGNPQEQLHIITSFGPLRVLAFSELDRLYMTILSAYPRWETMKRVLGGLLVYANTTIVKVFLNVDPDELALVLDALSSLIDMRRADASLSTDAMLYQLLRFTSFALTSRDTVSFCHLSFVEFLKDEARSGPFHIDVDDFRDEITGALFGMIHRSLDQDYGTDRHLNLNIDFATYRYMMCKVALSLWDSRIGTLFPVVVRMTERLQRIADSCELDTQRSMNSLVRFTEDMKLFERAIEAFFENPRLQENGHSPIKDSKTVDEFQMVCRMFKQAVFLAQKRAVHALALCSESEVTPVLVYMAEFYGGTEWITTRTLSAIPGATDFVSTIEQNRHIFDLSYFHPQKDWCLKLVDLKALFHDGHGKGSRIQASDEWKHQRSFLTHHLLKSTLKTWSPIDFADRENCLVLKECFFDLRNITDICTCAVTKTHQNPCKCSSLLEIICDLSTQTGRFWPKLKVFRRVPSFITSIISWLNRQLTNPQTLKLLQDHNEALPDRLAATMKFLLERFFLEEFTESYNKELCVRVHDRPCKRGMAMIVKVLPLPQGFYGDYDSVQIDDEDWHPGNPYWHAFHDEFEKTDRCLQGLIDRSSWYPHVASRALNGLVKFLFGKVYPRFSFSDSWGDRLKLHFKKSLSYIPQCLPFAHPNSENLEALRLIVYLYPHVIDVSTVSSLLPEGIWLSIAAFLQKYPRSALSSQELDLFESWLYSSDHSDIRKHVPKPSKEGFLGHT